ncbi:beta-ketoacyl synthase N-terminal-like domain-containing protein [Actinomyces sp. 2119]|uniref:beta-ketoacyl synthase N-terminal-like domain-containing protein n=1 Tax=Actinomyces sp. 2119 TaxID=2321393 RepID=UPI001602D981|nr:beta-ketoacyl synthase N-terminal-like domain-containing protein [Actinomyces sp. 2119]
MTDQISNRCFSAVLPCDSAPFRDHQVHGARVLPGVFLIDMVLRSLRGCGVDTARVELRRCRFRSPVVAEERDTHLRVELFALGAEPARAVVATRDLQDGTWTTRMECAILPASPWPEAEGAWNAEAPSGTEDLGEVYAFARSLGIQHGPFMRPGGWVAANGKRAWAELRLTGAAADAQEDFYIHPVLLDSATLMPFWALGPARRSELSEPLVPLFVDRVVARAPLPGRVRVLVPEVRSPAKGLETFESSILLGPLAGQEWSVGLFGFVAKRVRSAAHLGLSLGGSQAGTCPASATGDREGALCQGEEKATALRLVERLVQDRLGPGDGEVGPDRGFYELGLDSGDLLSMTDRLEELLGQQLYPTLLFDHPTPAALAAHLESEHAQAVDSLPAEVTVDDPATGPQRILSGALAAPGTRTEAPTLGPVAIVGLAGRFPGAETVEELWEVLASGADCVTEVPADRWDWRDHFDAAPGAAGKSYSRWGGFLDRPDCFDPLFFAISPRDAARMDPQERLFLETSWAVLEDAGYSPDRVQDELGGSVGVFVGAMWSDYQLFGLEESLRGNPQVAGSWFSSIPNRVSFALDLHGPSVAVDTACSSSLQAIHLACQSIRSGECRAALVGGVNLSLHPSKYATLSELRMLSPTGRCRAFGDEADGYVPGEGVGCVLLRPLQDALRAGDQILAVIRGSAVRHGGHTGGFSVPSASSQAALLRDALAASSTDAGSVAAIEAHGTGTALGDPIEVAALTEVFGSAREPGSCVLGSVKSNIGHLESASGIAALTKMVLSLRHRTHLPTLHAEPANPRLDLANTPFRLLRQAEPWEEAEYPRRAGISSFGAGGNNVHVILEEHAEAVPRVPRPAVEDHPVVVPLSARSQDRLGAVARRLRAHLESHPDVALPDVALTLQRGREAMEHRCAFVVRSVLELVRLLPRPEGEDGAAEPPQGIQGRSRELEPQALERVERWVDGQRIEWSQVWYPATQVERARTVTLPTYPFLRRRCWVDEAPPAVTSSAGRRLDRLRIRLVPPQEESLARVLVPVDAPWLTDHSFKGQPLVPGSVLLGILDDAVRSLGEASRSGPGLTGLTGLSRVTLLAPVRTTAPDQDLHLEVRRQGSGPGADYELVWADDLSGAPLGTAVVGDVAPLKDEDTATVRAGRTVPAAEVYRRLGQQGWEYGACLRLISSVEVEEARLSVRLADAAGPTPDVLLLDAALQSTVLLLPETGAPLPSVFTGVYLSGHQAETAVATVRRLRTGGGSHTFAVVVRGSDGQVLASVREVTLMEQTSSEVHVYAPRWVAEPLHKGSDHGERVAGCVLLVGTEAWRARREAVTVAQELGTPVVVVHEGDTYQRLGTTEFTVRHNHPEDQEEVLESLVAEGVTLRGILCTVFLDTASDAEAGIEQVLGLCTVLVRRAYELRTGLPVVVAVRSGAAAALAGLAQTVRLEQPAVRLRTVRVDDAPQADLLPMLAAELDNARVTDHRETRLEPERGRQVRAYTPVALSTAPDNEVPLVRESASYLITGGAGRLGLITARWLLAQRAAGSPIGLVLVGRSELGARRQADLDGLSTGPEVQVRYVRGDVADPAVAQKAVRTAAGLGTLRGVIHAAGSVEDGLMASRPSPALGAVWRTKVGGALALVEAVGDCDLDYFICYGSASSSLGSVGQAEYALANRFLTELALHAPRGARLGRVLTVDWPLWRDGGMEIPSGRAEKVLASAGLRLLETQEALGLLPQLMACGESSVAVLPGDAVRLEKRLGLVVSEERQAAVEDSRTELGTEPDPAASPPPAPRPQGWEDESGGVLAGLRVVMARLLKIDVDELEPDLRLDQFGIDSVVVMQALDEVEARFGVTASPSTIQAHMTLLDVAQELRGLGATAPAGLSAPVPAPPPDEPREDPAERPSWQTSGDSSPRGEECGIAVIAVAGCAGRAGSVARLWDALVSGSDVLAPAPAGHWSRSGSTSSSVVPDGPVRGAFLQESAFRRPTPFVGLPAVIDPQQEVLLGVLADLVAASGYTVEELQGARTGVFVGATGSGYVREQIRAGATASADLLASALTSMTASRVSKVLDLHGPCQVVDTACSSSLVAVHHACHSILAGECDSAVAGGVTLLPDPLTYELMGAAGLLSRAGRTRVFDQAADGYTLGEGAGLVMLKRADQAYAEGDQVLAVIRGTAVNHDGRSLGVSAPNAEVQRALFDQALVAASVSGGSIGHLEISGSANSFADPLEVHAAAQALARTDSRQPSCAISCLKSSTGALLHASGVLALIKTVLALHTTYLPASIGVETSHPRFVFDRTPFRLLTEGEDWAAAESGPRRGAVSSFGIGGTNALAVVEEADRGHRPRRGDPWLTWAGDDSRPTGTSAGLLAQVLDRLDRGELSALQAARALTEER